MSKIALVPPSPSTAAALLAAYESRAEDWRRDHLGASLIGHPCDRFLWLSFRWAKNPKHPGQRLRLFERGKREESWVIDDLRKAGFTVIDIDPKTGEQTMVVFGNGHLGGSLDGMISGLLEAPRTVHVLEIKTHNWKSFARLQKDGVKRAKPEHFTQMQVYMRGLGLERAFYVAVCKDNDGIHTERIELDRKFADAAIARAQAIIDMALPPERKENSEFPPCVYTSQDGTRWPCQFYDLCHNQVMPERNCRTCISATPVDGGEWRCEKFKITVDGVTQRAGCVAHLTIPPIVNAQVTDVDFEERRVEYQFADGRQVVDGGGG